MENTIQHYTLGLLAVANNIPALPVYLALCGSLPRAQQLKLCHVATLASFVTMVVAMLCGASILEFFEISLSAFRIAGGLLLVQTGVGMVNSSPSAAPVYDRQHLSEMIPVAIIPIAIPLTTGAGTISTVIVFSEKAHGGLLASELFAAIGIVTALNYAAFRWSTAVVRFLGTTGMNVVTKVFGLITLALGIQFILTGITDVFPALVGTVKNP